MTGTILLLELLLVQLLLAAFGLALVSPTAGRYRRALVAGAPILLINGFLIACLVVLVMAGAAAAALIALIVLSLAACAGASWLYRRHRDRGPWSARRIGIWLAVSVVLLVQTHRQWHLGSVHALQVRAASNGALAMGLLARPPSSADNAAPHYLRLGEQLEDDPHHAALTDRDFAALWHDEDPPTDAPTWSECAAALAPLTPQVERLHELSRLPSCSFSWEVGAELYATPLPEITHARSAARLLEWHARLALHHGDHVTALADAQALLRMGEHHAAAPFLISQLVATHITTTAHDLLHDTLARSSIAAWTAPIGPRTLHHAWRRRLADAILIEELSMVRLLAQLAAHAGTTDGPVVSFLPPVQMMTASGVLLLFGPALLDTELRALDAVFGALRTRLRRSRAENDPAVVLDHTLEAATIDGVLIGMLTPAWYSTARNMARLDAHTRLARTAERLIAHRRATGVWADPTTLPRDSAGNAWANDPFTDRPLRHRVDDDTLVLWSIGTDGNDDNGLPVDSHNDRTDGDIVLILRP